MADTLKTFVGARLAVDKDRSEPSDVAAEDAALVSLLAGAGISDSDGRAHFAQVLRKHLLTPVVSTAATSAVTGSASNAGASSSTEMSDEFPLQQDRDTDQSASSGTAGLSGGPQHAGHTHGIASHGHRAFLIDDNNPAAGSTDKSSHNSGQQTT